MFKAVDIKSDKLCTASGVLPTDEGKFGNVISFNVFPILKQVKMDFGLCRVLLGNLFSFSHHTDKSLYEGLLDFNRILHLLITFFFFFNGRNKDYSE